MEAFLSFLLRGTCVETGSGGGTNLKAHRQGRFWEFHEVVFDGAASIAASAAAAGNIRPAKMAEYAASSGLDPQEFAVCMAESHLKDVIKSDIALGHAVGVTVTPTIYINGRPIIGALEPWMLEAAIERIKSLPPPPPEVQTTPSPDPPVSREVETPK